MQAEIDAAVGILAALAVLIALFGIVAGLTVLAYNLVQDRRRMPR